MKIKGLFTAIVYSILALSLTACPQNTGKNKKSAGVKRVKGDPNVFIRNAVLNGSVPLPFGMATSTTSWEIEVAGFAEGSAEVDVDTLIQGQTPSEKVVEADSLNSEIHGSHWILSGKLRKSPVKFVFHRANEGWTLKSYEADGKNVTLGAPKSDVVVHTSITPDQTAFSLLLQDKTMGARSVVSLTFTHAKPAIKRMGDTLFEFLHGKGVKIGWRRDLPRKILICGSLPAILPQIVSQAAAVWSAALEDRLALKAVTQIACPPFSDLNTQTFNFTTEWIEIAGEPGVEAQVLSLFSSGQEFLLDGDAFYLLGEYQESLEAKGVKANVLSPEILSRPGMQEQILRTTIHELGHFLGLHHQFNPSIDSIMSYSETTLPKLYDYDVKAIQHLYSD